MPAGRVLQGPGARQGDDAASGLGLRLFNPGPYVYETAVRHGIEAAERQREAPPWVRQPLPGQPGYGVEGRARVLRDSASVGSSDGVYGSSPLLAHTYSRRLQAWNQKMSIVQGPPRADGSSVPRSPADDMAQYARVPPLWDGDESTQYDLNFVDVRAPQSGTTPRVMPMTPPLEVYAAPRGMGECHAGGTHTAVRKGNAADSPFISARRLPPSPLQACRRLWVACTQAR